MKVMARTKILRAALDQLLLVVTRSTTLPIVLDLKMETEDGKLKLSATDLYTYLVVSIPLWGVSSDLSQVLIPARSLGRFIPRKTDGVISIESPSDLSRLSLSYESEDVEGQARVEFQFLPPIEDFPPAPVIDQVVATKSVDAGWFCNMLNAIGACAATEDTRPILTGICLQNGCMAAADGFRLGVVESDKLDFGLPAGSNAIVPWKAMKVVARLFSRSSDICITFGNSLVGFEGDGKYLLTRAIDGVYPKFDQLIPQYETPCVSFQALVMEQFLSMVESSSGIVRLEFDFEKQQCSMSCSDVEIAEYKMSLPARVDKWPDPIRIAFNERYLRDVLHPFTTCDLVLTENSQPG